MKVIEVIPISRAISKRSLSYFTSQSIPQGSVISVPLRKKKIKAIVLKCTNVSSSKATIKSQEYSIKKTENTLPQKVFLPEFILAAEKMAEFMATSTGAVLSSLLPKIILDEFERIGIKPKKVEKGIYDKFIIQAGEVERFANYKNIIREQFAKKKSVIFLAPTSKLAERSYGILQKGIKNYSFLVHNSLKKSELISNLKDINHIDRPILIVATGSFLSIPRSDLGAIILEKENSRFYKGKRRPYVDIRDFAEFLSQEIGVKLYFGDIYLRTETIWRWKKGEFLEATPPSFRVPAPLKQKVVDMKSKNHTLKGFQLISHELNSLLTKATLAQEKVFIFNARYGLHPVTACGDCGQTVKCERCSSPVVLHGSPGKNKQNFFLCHKCGRSRSAEIRCANCNSWKLQPLGIGTGFIEKELKAQFKGVNIYRIDGDTTNTPKKREKMADEFYAEKGGILLGTEMALSYLKSIPHSAIISLDSFFSVPDFRINEKIINIVLSIKEKTKEKFLLQTRNRSQKVLDHAMSGSLREFYREEIKQREEYGFPPFFIFIKITFSGDKKSVVTEGEKLKEYFNGYDISVYPGFVSYLKGRHIMNALIKLERNDWPEKILKEKLLALPAKFSVNINPDNLL